MTGDEFAALFGPARFELRFDLAGRAAVRVAGGPVAPRHVEPVPPAGAVGDRGALRRRRRLVARRCRAGRSRPGGTAARALRRARGGAAPAGRRRGRRRPWARSCWSGSRTGCGPTSRRCRRWPTGRSPACSTRRTWKGCRRSSGATTREALRRLSGVREVMTVLDPESRRAARADRRDAARRARGRGPRRDRDGDRARGGETPLTLIPGAGWGACARRLAADERFDMFAVGPDSGGWNVTTRTFGTTGQLDGAVRRRPRRTRDISWLQRAVRRS